MKNLKNMFAWITLAVVLTLGTIGANAGVMISDAPQCTDTKGNLVQSILGIIVITAPSIAGVMISDAPCRNGVMISD